ncbi:MAG: DUF4974 domain-containing protein [Marinilabilia sp.]
MRELFKKYTEGKCTAEEKNLVQEKLSDLAPTGELLCFLKKYWYEINEDDAKESGHVDFDSILNKIHHSVNFLEEEERKKQDTFIRRFYTWSRLAAAVLIIFFASAGVWYAGQTGLFQKEVFYTVSSDRGQSSNVTLPDGSQAWINGESSLRYSSKYGPDNRTIHLDGEGFFRVAEDKRSSFMVKVRDAEITATGTAFNVDAHDDDRPVKVTLEEGLVRINSSNEEIDLKPGMQALVSGEKITSRMVDTELYTSWHRGHIVFKNERLETITKQLEKMYDVNFHYKCDTLKSFRYRGTIRLDNSILKALDMLRLSTGIKYNVDGNRVELDN